MSRYDQKFKPYCRACMDNRLMVANGKPRRVMADVLRYNKRSVVYKCARCGHEWNSRAKHALREIARNKREGVK